MKKRFLAALLSILWMPGSGQTLQRQTDFENYRKYIGERLYAPDSRIYLFTDQPTTIQLPNQFQNSYYKRSKYSAINYDKVSTLMYKPSIRVVSESFSDATSQSLRAELSAPTQKYIFHTPIITCDVIGQYFTVIDVIHLSDFRSRIAGFYTNSTNDLMELYNSKPHKTGRILSPEPRTYVSGWGKRFITPDTKTPRVIQKSETPVFVLKDAEGNRLYWIPQFNPKHTDLLQESYLKKIENTYVGKTFINIADFWRGEPLTPTGQTLTVTSVQYQSTEAEPELRRGVSLLRGNPNSLYGRPMDFVTTCLQRLPEEQQKWGDWQFAYEVGVTFTTKEGTTTRSFDEFYNRISNTREYKEYNAYLTEEKLKQQRAEEKRLAQEARAKKEETSIAHGYTVVTNGRAKRYNYDVEITFRKDPLKVTFKNLDTKETLVVDRAVKNSTRNSTMDVNQYGLGAGGEVRARVNGANCVFRTDMIIGAGVVTMIFTIKYMNGNMRIYKVEETFGM